MDDIDTDIDIGWRFDEVDQVFTAMVVLGPNFVLFMASGMCLSGYVFLPAIISTLNRKKIHPSLLTVILHIPVHNKTSKPARQTSTIIPRVTYNIERKKKIQSHTYWALTSSRLRLWRVYKKQANICQARDGLFSLSKITKPQRQTRHAKSFIIKKRLRTLSALRRNRPHVRRMPCCSQ